VLQYDFGKAMQNEGFKITGALNNPPTILLTAVNALKARYEADGHNIEELINQIFRRKTRLQRKYKRPKPESDRLYVPILVHPSDGNKGCATACGDDPQNLISRLPRTADDDNPMIHYGLVATANQVMKDALVRDTLSTNYDVLCFEMEAAGLMNHFPCLVIRGICDYSDSHKNCEWQGYAAMAAAAYARNLLCQILPSKVESEKTIHDRLSSVEGQLTSLGETTERVESKVNLAEEQKVLDWFYSPIISSNYHKSVQSRTPGSGQWLLNSDMYMAWRKCPQGLLWLFGAGKITPNWKFYFPLN
jgi:hypothetical protein